MRILVVEDEDDLLHLLVQSLREAGYSVDEAANGQIGLCRALEAEYDGIILDLMLPGMNGIEVLQRLRRAKTIPVLLLTARDGVADRVEGLDAGADDYLTKPFELPELLARVRAMIRRSAGGAVMMAQLGAVTLDTLARTVSKLESARRVQMRLTPQDLPQMPGVDVAFDYRPAQVVGGDFCDVWPLQEGRLAFAVGDVAGKGLPGAMVMANLQALLQAGTLFCNGPAQAVAYLNQHLRQHFADGPFVTLFLGLLEVGTGRLEYVNAGHLPPLLVQAGAAVEPLGQPTNTVLGIGDDVFTADVAMLTPGACLVAFTDGITESESPDGALFGLDRLQRALQPTAGAKAERLVRAVVEGSAAFSGAGPRADDMTVLAIRWLGNRSESEVSRFDRQATTPQYTRGSVLHP